MSDELPLETKQAAAELKTVVDNRPEPPPDGAIATIEFRNGELVWNYDGVQMAHVCNGHMTHYLDALDALRFNY